MVYLVSCCVLIGHDKVLVIVVRSSHFCSDFLYLEMYSLQKCFQLRILEMTEVHQ